MSNNTTDTSSFSDAKIASLATLDSITELLKKTIKGNIISVAGQKTYSGYIDEDKTIFALDKAIKELEYWINKMPDPEPDHEDESQKTKAEEFKNNIKTVKDTLESTSKLNNAFIEMSNNGAPFVEFKSVDSPVSEWTPTTDEMPYIELWGETQNHGLAKLKDLNGTISLRGQYGNIDVEGESDFERNKCRFNVDIAIKDNSGNYITKPVYNGSGTYEGNTVYLVIRGETVTDSNSKTIDRKYYDFLMKNQTVKIVKIGNRMMAHVNFNFVFPVGSNRDKYLEYPEKYFSIAKNLPPYNLEDIDTSDINKYYEENGFWLYVVDNRNEFY